MPDRANSRTSPTLLGKLRQSPTDQAAWEQFVQVYGPKITDWCRRWGLQDADTQDVTQMVFLRLAARMREFQYDAARSFRAWLMTISRHAWNDLVTSRTHRVGSSNREAIAQLESIPARDDLAQRIEAAYDLELLQNAFARIRLRVQPQTWEAYRLTTLDGCSGAEAAARLNMNLTSVFKAKSNVQKLIQDELRYLEGADPS
jgi:RNA polymerase sigma-70 factor (ECF subfamily)